MKSEECRIHFPPFILHSSFSFFIHHSSFKKLCHTTKTNATTFTESIHIQLENKQILSRIKTTSNRVTNSKTLNNRVINSKTKVTRTISNKVIKTKAFSSKHIKPTPSMRGILYRQAAT